MLSVNKKENRREDRNRLKKRRKAAGMEGCMASLNVD